MSIRSQITGMPSSGLSTVRLAAFWFGIQAVWGALLGLSLQARTLQLHAAGAVIAYGELAAAGAFVAIAVQVLAGMSSDRRRLRGQNRGAYFLWGTAIATVGLAAFYGAPTFWFLVGALMVLQIGMNLAIAPYQAVIPDYVPESAAGRASSSMATLQSLGNAAGALAVVIAHGGVPVAAFLAVVLIVTCLVTTRYVARLSARPIEPQGARAKASADLFISRAFMWVAFYTILGYMVFYVRDAVRVADPTASSGIVILLFTLFGAFGAAAAAAPADRADRRAVVSVAAAVVMAAVVGLIFTRSLILVYVFGAAAGAPLAADARVARIYGGANEIMKLIIARSL